MPTTSSTYQEYEKTLLLQTEPSLKQCYSTLSHVSILNILARASHVQYVNVMVPSTIVVVIFIGSLVYNSLYTRDPMAAN